MSERQLNPLAFGDHRASDFHSVVAAQDEAARLLPGLRHFDFQDRNNFRFKSSFASVNGLPIAAVSTPAARILFGDRIAPALVFPFVGRADFLAEKSVLTMQASQSAIFVPPGIANEVKGSDRSVAVAQINAIRLESTARVMLGVHFHESLLARLHAMTAMGLSHGGVSFDEVFRGLFAMVDSYRGNPLMLNASGIDDTFYRTLVIALLPDIFARQREVPLSYRTRQVQEICDYVMANLDKRITLTELEHLGHMSRRTMHNAFFKTFGLSPIQWVRDQRLMKAQSLLSSLKNFQSVTEVLYSCGFTHPSLFSAHYRQRFGETPSQTVMSTVKTRQ